MLTVTVILIISEIESYFVSVKFYIFENIHAFSFLFCNSTPQHLTKSQSFSLCLSAEFGKSAYVGCICPGFSNTDVFRNQSASEKDFKLIRKLSTSPQKIAKKTVKAIKAKKKLKIIGYDAKLMNFFYKLMPITTSKIITKILKKSGMQLFKNL